MFSRILLAGVAGIVLSSAGIAQAFQPANEFNRADVERVLQDPSFREYVLMHPCEFGVDTQRAAGFDGNYGRNQSPSCRFN